MTDMFIDCKNLKEIKVNNNSLQQFRNNNKRLKNIIISY